MTGLGPCLEAALDRIEVGTDRAIVAGKEIKSATSWELTYALAARLYEQLHVGREVYDRARIPRRDGPLEQQLRAAVGHRHTTVPATPAGSHPDGRQVVRTPEGVRVRPDDPDDDSSTMRLAPCRPALSPGFFLVDGPRTIHGTQPDLLRVYVHLRDPAAAVVAWQAALTVLQPTPSAFRMKVVSDPAGYPRQDALVLYLPPETWWALRPLVAGWIATEVVADGESPFAHRLAPGVAIAFESAYPRRREARLSFGQHRAKAVADGLVTAATTGLPRLSAVADALRTANVDPVEPSRNLDSPPLPSSSRMPQDGSETTAHPCGT